MKISEDEVKRLRKIIRKMLEVHEGELRTVMLQLLHSPEPAYQSLLNVVGSVRSLRRWAYGHLLNREKLTNEQLVQMIGFAENYVEEAAFRLLTGERAPYSLDREFSMGKGWTKLRDETYQRLLNQNPTDENLAGVEEAKSKAKKYFASSREEFAAKIATAPFSSSQ